MINTMMIAGTRVFHKKTNHRLSQPMAMEHKAQHVDVMDVVLDSIPCLRAFFQ